MERNARKRVHKFKKKFRRKIMQLEDSDRINFYDTWIEE